MVGIILRHYLGEQPPFSLKIAWYLETNALMELLE
tara:strand:+ start:312 stop:416 length:105 start_codon:yes stop_codon:yes gene_type:complete